MFNTKLQESHKSSTYQNTAVRKSTGCTLCPPLSGADKVNIVGSPISMKLLFILLMIRNQDLTNKKWKKVDFTSLKANENYC